ncbi:MAG: hypothetical protein IPK07_25385 [Deltaproteobacteria bacterium]|nr:hypothetical protein [Deltaproteobacteria bacterium]
MLRGQLIEAIAAGHDAGTAGAVQALALDPNVRAEEVHNLLETYMYWPDNRAEGRAWMRRNKDRLLARVPAMWQGYTGWLYREGQCTDAEAQDFQRVWEKRLANVEGGPRNVAQAIEATRLCAALREKQSLTEFGKSLEVKGE